MCPNVLTVMSLCMDKAIAWLVCRLFVDMLCHNLA